MKTIFYFIFYSHLFLLHTYSFNSSHTGFIFIPQKWPKGPYLSPCLCFGSSFFLVCPFYFDWHIWFKGLTYRHLLPEACPDSTSGAVTPLTFVCAFSFVWTSVTLNWDVLGVPGSICLQLLSFSPSLPSPQPPYLSQPQALAPRDHSLDVYGMKGPLCQFSPPKLCLVCPPASMPVPKCPVVARSSERASSMNPWWK